MVSALLITLREGLEAALIIGIVLAYLATTGNRKRFKDVWMGTALAIAVSLIAGIVIYFSAGRFEGRAEEIFEGSAMLVAAVILTWMIFWMRKQAVNIKDHLQSQIQSALGRRSALGLIGLAFFVVVREGIETVLFLFAATRTAESQVLSLLGGIIGLTVAIAIGYGIYKGTARLNLKTFFNVTNLLLILFAAGLLAHGLHEFQEAKLIPIIVEHIWDINHVIAEDSIFGRFLTAIFGYNANPSLIEFTSYLTYLVLATVNYSYPILKKKGGD
ncbi:iron uptake transporter permease EfeU [Chloroflexota bacterium]